MRHFCHLSAGDVTADMHLLPAN